MSKVKGCNYRVVDQATNNVVFAIEYGKSSAALPDMSGRQFKT
jgi:hypothetical protein|tara:strand:- start:182 stop:310 length:129 start_codon:yes stop_codon:yes gene_type:complete